MEALGGEAAESWPGSDEFSGKNRTEILAPPSVSCPSCGTAPREGEDDGPLPGGEAGVRSNLPPWSAEGNRQKLRNFLAMIPMLSTPSPAHHE